MSRSLSSIMSNESYREAVIETLCKGVGNTALDDVVKAPVGIRRVLEHVVENRLDLFEGEDFEGKLYGDDEETAYLILPSVRKAWASFFVYPPALFSGKKLELFQLLFDADEFVEYLAETLPKVKSSLSSFEKLDRTAETLSLIVANYVAGKVEQARLSKDPASDIRDAKLRRLNSNI